MADSWSKLVEKPPHTIWYQMFAHVYMHMSYYTSCFENILSKII